jgi:hypothetical protein
MWVNATARYDLMAVDFVSGRTTRHTYLDCTQSAMAGTQCGVADRGT